MPMPPVNDNIIPVHTAVTRQQRDYLTHLASTPGLTKTGTVNELLSYGAAAFLTARPYENPKWEWIRPQGYYSYVNGERMRNGDWVALNPGICDIQVNGGETLSSARIVSSLESVARSQIPPIRSTDTGMNSLLHNLIRWMVSDLYPPSKYGATKVSAPKLKIEAAKLPNGRSRVRA